MDFDQDTKDCLQSLTEYAQARSILPVVGAGLSASFGYPLWGQFLLDTARIFDKYDEIHGHIQNGKFEEAADKLYITNSEKMEEQITLLLGREQPIRNYLEHTQIDPLNNPNTPAALVLPYLTTGPVLTLNFDPVLQIIYEHAGRPFNYIAQGAIGIADAISRHQHILVKLHGTAADKNTRVLTGREYSKHYLEGHTIDYGKKLPMALRCAFGKRLALFLGCSLTSDRYLDVVRETQEFFKFNDYHYAILERPSNDKEKADQHRRLLNHGIIPIWYPKGNYLFITAILQHLCQSIRQAQHQNSALYPVTKSNIEPQSVPVSMTNPREPARSDFSSVINLYSNSPMQILGYIDNAQKFGNPIVTSLFTKDPSFTELRPGFSSGFMKRLDLRRDGDNVTLIAFPWLIDVESGATRAKFPFAAGNPLIDKQFLYCPFGKNHNIRFKIELLRNSDNAFVLKINNEKRADVAMIFEVNLPVEGLR